MSPILFLAIILLLIFFIYDLVSSKRSENFPPGPFKIPLIGNYLQLLLENYNFPHIALDQLKKKYQSPIIGLYLGDQKVIVANTYETCREVFTRPEYQARLDGIVPRTRAFGKKLGIFFDDGENWLHQRRFSLRELRDFGFGRRSESFEQVVEEEISDLINQLRKLCENGESILVPDAFYPIMINCILHLLAGFRLQPEDHEKLKELGKVMMRFQRSNDATGRIISIFPFLRYFMPKKIGYDDVRETSEILYNFFQSKIREHKKTFDKDFMRDYIDTYCNKMQDNSNLSEDQLTMCCIDLTFPATAAASTVSLALMYVIKNPAVLEKCQNELDLVVGTGRRVTLNDRQYLPYTEATLREVMRKSPIAPLGVFHRSTENSTFFGYEIPADTVMVTNLYSMHMDEKLWGDPENFRPERFLDYKGNLKKKDYTLPFGLGKRVCAGETFARQNVFLTMANIFHQFNIAEDSPVDFNEIHPGLIINPRDDFYIKLIPRY